MAIPPKNVNLADVLQHGGFKNPIFDPVPPWLFSFLNEAQQHELANEHLQLQKEILQVQVKSLDRQIALLSKGR